MKQSLIILTLLLLSLAAGLNATFLKRGGKDSSSSNSNKKEIYFVPESPTVVQPVVTQSQTSITVPSSPQTFYSSTNSIYEETPLYVQSASINTAAPVIAKVERVYRSDEQEVAQEYGLNNFDHDLEIVKKPISEHPHPQSEPEHQKTAGLLNRTHSQVSEAFEKIRQIGLSIDSREKLVDFLSKITHFNKALGFHKEQLLKSIHKNYDILETINTQLLQAKNRMLLLDNHDIHTLSTKVHDIDALKEQIRNIQRIRNLFVEVDKANVWDQRSTVYSNVPTILVKYFTLNNLVYRVNHFVTYHETDPCDVFFRHISVIPIYNWVHPVYFTELSNYVRIENRVSTIYSNFGAVLNNVVVSDDVKLDSIESKLTKDLEDVQKSFEQLGTQLKSGSTTSTAKESELSNIPEQDNESSEEDSKTEKIEEALEKDVKKSNSKRTSSNSEQTDESLTDTFNELEKELQADKEEQQKLEAETLKNSNDEKVESEKSNEESSKETDVKAEVLEEDAAENNSGEEESHEKKKKEEVQSKKNYNKVNHADKEEESKAKINSDNNSKKTLTVKKKNSKEESKEKSEEEEDKNDNKESNDEEDSNEEPKDEDKDFEGLDLKLEQFKNKHEEKKKKEKVKKPTKSEIKVVAEDTEDEDDLLNEREKSLFKEEDAEEAAENSKVFAKKVNEKNAIFNKRFNKKQSEKSKKATKKNYRGVPAV